LEKSLLSSATSRNTSYFNVVLFDNAQFKPAQLVPLNAYMIGTEKFIIHRASFEVSERSDYSLSPAAKRRRQRPSQRGKRTPKTCLHLFFHSRIMYFPDEKHIVG
jgi:hypothetical protein